MRLLLIIILALSCLGFTHIEARPRAAAGGGETISYISFSSNGDAGTSVIVTSPASIADGDMLIITAAGEGSGTVTSTGFTSVLNLSGSHVGAMLYKIASSESGNYTVSFGSSSVLAHISVYRKTGGSWTAPTTAGYNNGSLGTSVGETAGPLNLAAGDMLVGNFTNDSSATISTDPVSMNLVEYKAEGSHRGALYYLAYPTLASSVSKNAVWSTSYLNSAGLVVLHAE